MSITRKTPEELFQLANEALQRGDQVSEQDMLSALVSNGWYGNYEVRRDVVRRNNWIFTYIPSERDRPMPST